MTEVEKVRVLLPHLIEHNHSHEKEFAKWATVLASNGQQEAAALMNEAIDHLQKAAQGLEAALTRIGGPLKGKDHHHQHHHD
jgi:rubrerythrin